MMTELDKAKAKHAHFEELLNEARQALRAAQERVKRAEEAERAALREFFEVEIRADLAAAAETKE